MGQADRDASGGAHSSPRKSDGGQPSKKRIVQNGETKKDWGGGAHAPVTKIRTLLPTPNQKKTAKDERHRMGVKTEKEFC